jgi:hypothetical protein
MSVTGWRMVCTVDGCLEELEARNVPTLRALAAERGWRLFAMGQFCPAHNAAFNLRARKTEDA